LTARHRQLTEATVVAPGDLEDEEEICTQLVGWTTEIPCYILYSNCRLIVHTLLSLVSKGKAGGDNYDIVVVVVVDDVLRAVVIDAAAADYYYYYVT
jgi:hypothetical protein